jgi:hypothetical protein
MNSVHFEGLNSLKEVVLARSVSGKEAKTFWFKAIDPELVVRKLTEALPSSDSDIDNFRNEYLLTEIMSKYRPETVDDAKLDSAAMIKFHEAEDLCRSVNNNGLDLTNEVLFEAQRIVSKVLGIIPRDLFEGSRFTSGATTSRKRLNGDPFYKYHSSRPLHVTPSSYNLAYALITATPLWCSNGAWDNITRVAGNRITTVPKNAKVNRVIAKEPDLNSHMQVAVGKHIRSRLKNSLNVDLKDQSINRDLARIGSQNGTLCTIDLSSASDTLSIRTVWELLPPCWYELLDKLRSHYGTLPDGSLIKYEKFSSMGNGFTFELESLLFYAISEAAQLGNGRTPFTNVYGDDIIVPTEHYPLVSSALEGAGFIVNHDKSFFSGSFRESCGGHYYKGVDVTPFYIRKPIDSIERVIWLLNRIRLWSYSEELRICDPRTRQLWLFFRRRSIDPLLLGGRNPESTMQVLSPNGGGYKLTPKTKDKKVDGWRAILRYFQNCKRSDSSSLRYTGFPLIRDLQLNGDGWSTVSRPVESGSSQISLSRPGVYGFDISHDRTWYDNLFVYPNE